MLDASRFAEAIPGAAPILLYKNNTDNKGASYGAHENYLMRRTTPFSDIVKHLTPFFVSRQVVCGAGRVGIGQDGREHGFQISQRADYFEVEVGLETTLKRPIINTRDEPHADPEKYRRLHVIIGDANLAEISTYLKVGTTSLVLAMIEDRFIGGDHAVEQPVRALRDVSHDPTLQAPAHPGRRPEADRRTAADGVPRPGQQVRRGPARLRRRRRRPSTCSPAGSRCSTGSSRTRCCAPASSTGSPSCSCSSSTATATAWTGTTPSCTSSTCSTPTSGPTRGSTTGWSGSAGSSGCSTDEEVAAAMHKPPEDTRAYFRGRCLEQYADQIAAASWDSVIFDLPGRESLQRVPTIDPLRGSKAHVGELLDRCDTAEALFARADSVGSVVRTVVTAVGRQLSQGDRMAQEQKQPKKASETEDQTEAAPQSDVAERKEQLDEDIDAILDEIDDVLETNAEDFVKSFIQKGGE